MKLSEIKASSLVTVIAVITSMFLVCTTAYYRDRLRNIDTTWMADSLSVYHNKLDEEYAQKAMLLSSINDLKERNNALYEETKRLKEHPVIVSRVLTETIIDTVYTSTDTVYVDKENGMVSSSWNAYDNDYYTVSGKTDISLEGDSASTVINSIRMNAMLRYDVVDNGRNLSVLVRSDNPYMNVSDIQGAFIDPAKSKTISKRFDKRWGVGPYVGVGIGYSGQSLKPELSVGIAVQYSLWRF